MRIHDRYLLSFFFRAFVLCTLAFLAIFILADVSEKIDNYIDHQASVSSVVRLYAFKVFDIVRLTLPVDLLLATIFTFGVMAKNNEVAALLSSGISMWRISLPIVVVAVLSVGLSLLLSEFIVPKTNARMLTIRRVEIEKRPPVDAPVRHDFTYRGRAGYLYYVRLFNVDAQTLSGVVVHQYRDGRLVARLDAEQAVWRDTHWEFRNGFYRTFAAETAARDLAGVGEQAEAFSTKLLPDLVERPEELARVHPEPEAMSYRELHDYTERVRQSGGNVNDYLVDLHTKISYPFTNLILTLLGIGLSASKRKSSLAAGFGITLIICFAYLGISEIAAALGKNEALSPLVAAWIGPAFFGAASVVLLLRFNR